MTDASCGEIAADRAVWSVTGADRFSFLQGMLSNDVTALQKAPGIVWTALLTPQGKYLADFFVVQRAGADDLLIDIKARIAADTIKRLSMYRLRADVQFAPCDLTVTRGLGAAPAGAMPDPRHAALGWRGYGLAGGAAQIDWDAIRVAHCIPETGIELIANDSYLLEVGFDRLHGVDFRKGCYVGQEVTARMKHKTEMKKGLVTVAIDGVAPVGTQVLSGDKEAGVLFTQSGSKAIAFVRFDRMEAMTAGQARLTALP